MTGNRQAIANNGPAITKISLPVSWQASGAMAMNSR
jgi:hypothetical protein